MENQKISLIKMQKRVNSKIDLAKAIIYIILCFNNIKLSETEVTVCAYFMVYGINLQTKNLIIKSGIVKNINNIKTIMVRLKKQGLIYKDSEFSGKVLLTKELSFELTPTACLYLKIGTQTV